ncbi:MAG: sensor histidine kinase [Cyclobacteriaceae bacterium]|nr:sensor histidine kinase [Cyclobacteriaceae bacterium]
MEGSEEIVSDISYNIILILGTAGMLLLGTAISIFIFIFQRKLIKRKLAYQKIEDLLKKQELKSAYALLKGQDSERKRIASELHDNLGGILVTLNMFVDTLLDKSLTEDQKKVAERIREVSHKASEEARNLSHQLDSASLKHFGFKSALADLIRMVDETKSVNIISNIELRGELENEVGHNLYRCIQELINNTLKHARATAINIEITQIAGEYINLIFEDNGVGFDMEEIKGKGIGLKSIETRVEQINGQLTVDSVKDKGTTVIIDIPLK